MNFTTSPPDCETKNRCKLVDEGSNGSNNTARCLACSKTFIVTEGPSGTQTLTDVTQAA